MSADLPRTERAQTDESLRVERKQTDVALAEKQAKVEETADAVILHARETADAVLDDAREKADGQLDKTGAPNPARATVEKERAREDSALEAERAAADESLERERQETTLALAKLLPLERVKTDRYLLTERVRSDDALANRDDFLGIVSHDLRNLLGGIVTSASLLATMAGEDAEGTKVLAGTARIQRYAARMNRLIGDLLDVASIDAGRLAIHAVPGDVAAVVQEAVELLAGDAAARNIDLRADVEGSTLAIFDHDRIMQVLANLISNAVKFSPDGGRVSLCVAASSEGVRVSIVDSGVGIPEKMLESVFRRFWQAVDNDSRGLGLGLYISRSIIEEHGGRIWAKSVAGEGSTFIFTLPVPPA